MRQRRLTMAVTASISLLALVPASALAHRHPNRSGRCVVRIQVAPREIVAGEQAIVFGRLRCVNQARAANQQVKLFQRLPGTFHYSYVQSATTDARGFYELVGAGGTIDTNRSWFVRAHGAQSAVAHIRVESQVTLAGPPEGQLLTGVPNRVTFTGSVSPADVGARVVLQRQDATTGSRWHHIDSGVVDGSGSFSIVHRFIVPGDANIRVLVRSQGRNIPSTSNVLSYEISQAQNPQLTIQASVDPIVFGQSVTISGKLASGASQGVSLLARTRDQHGFSIVAQATTNAAGEYSFPAQAPTNSTFYRVQATSSCGPVPSPPPPGHVECLRAMRVSSAVLYEGVKDLLTAQVSATQVQAGGTVTFSGTVSPDHTGHAIYLERQNAQGSGFHPVQVAYVGGGSTYSIVHRLYVPGTKVLRVFIPGGPENQGAVSAPFTVTVTPGPASALVPEAPGNSTLPPEGR
jgi:hypothetical protein